MKNGARRGRTARVAVAAAVIAVPLLATAGVAAADPGPNGGPAQPTVRLVDYDDWYHWHCQVQHEWWRPHCHDHDWDRPDPPATGSAV